MNLITFLCSIMFFQFFFVFPIQAEPPKKEFAVLGPVYAAGLFSHYFTIMGFLESYDRGGYAGVKIEYENVGIYYEAAYGPNWWEYYFERIDQGDQNAPHITYEWLVCAKEAGRGLHLPRHRGAEIINKYIHVKPFIQERIDSFEKNKFNANYVIGVHYRGTDKITAGEAPFTSIEQVAQAVNDHIQTNKLSDYNIFVATDEEKFLNYMLENFPGKVVYQEALRSPNSERVHGSYRHIHGAEYSRYQTGVEAVVDGYLLARCDFLVRTISNLSHVSTYINPDLPVICIQAPWSK